MTASVQILSWAGACGPEDAVVLDHDALTPPYFRSRIAVAGGDEHRAVQLLDGGAAQVLVGEAALRDGGCIARLVARYGAERVGLYVPVRRAPVDWSLDADSNADFTFLSSSIAAPRWEALLSDGGTTGADALWWVEQMVAAGASMALFDSAFGEEDLLIAAECVERLGPKAWFATRAARPDLASWLRLAGATRFVVADPAAATARLAEAAA